MHIKDACELQKKITEKVHGTVAQRQKRDTISRKTAEGQQKRPFKDPSKVANVSMCITTYVTKRKITKHIISRESERFSLEEVVKWSECEHKLEEMAHKWWWSCLSKSCWSNVGATQSLTDMFALYYDKGWHTVAFHASEAADSRRNWTSATQPLSAMQEITARNSLRIVASLRVGIFRKVHWSFRTSSAL